MSGFPKIPVGHECDVMEADFRAHESAIAAGNIDIAAAIETEVGEKLLRCAGSIMCHGVRECGLEHGKEVPTAGPFSPDYKLFSDKPVNLNTTNNL